MAAVAAAAAAAEVGGQGKQKSGGGGSSGSGMVVGQYKAGRQALESGRKEEEPGLMDVCFGEVFEWSVINFSDSR